MPVRKVRSFRARIALLSLLVSGLVLLAFAIPAWFLIGRIDLQRIDNEVGERALPHLAWAPDNRHWGMLEDELRYTYGACLPTSCFLLVRGRDGATVWRSQYWPEALKTGVFPLPGGNESRDAARAAAPAPAT